MMRRFVSLLLVVSLLFSSFTPVYAQALPSRVAVAIGGVLERNFARLGFAANDPRIASTLTAVGVAANDSVFAVASGVGMVAAGVVGLPAWATVAIGLGIGALAFGAYKLLSGSGSTPFSVQLPPVPESTIPNGIPSTYTAFCETCAVDPSFPYKFRPYSTTYGVKNISDLRTITDTLGWGTFLSSSVQPGVPGQNGALCVSYSAGSGCAAPNPLAPVVPSIVPPVVPGTLDQAIQSIPPEAMNQPMDPATLAELANSALQRAAAQPGYQGIPAPLNQPVTQQDALDWSMANPGKMPTPADVVAALPNGVVMPPPVGAIAPNPTPTPTPTPTGPTNVTTSDTFVPPGMENAPTAAQILAPILGLLPDFRSYVTPSHAATCPTPSVDVFGKHLVLDAHCTLLDSPGVRQVLYAVMAAVWTIVAIFIILAA